MDIEQQDRLRACLICGAIGDALGGRFEGTEGELLVDFDFEWRISDDTQLTLATCEAIFGAEKVLPELVAASFLRWFNQQRLTGLGSSTLKALRELQLGGHWALVGNTGEYAAGNGAAMRIAPLAFKQNISKQTIRDLCFITHRNEEAYVGALAIFKAIGYAAQGKWKGERNLVSMVLSDLPDTRVKDKLIEFERHTYMPVKDLSGKFVPTGFVADSVPIALFAAQQINERGFQEVLTQLIALGGDTDTTCSMTGQIIGALKGTSVIPQVWMSHYETLGISILVEQLVQNWRE